MWTIFSDLRNLKINGRADRIFRVVGYGTILVLLCFVSGLMAVIVITTSLIGGLAFFLLRSLQPGSASLIHSLSPRSRRWVRASSIISSLCFLLVLGCAYTGETSGRSLPLLLPLLLIVAFLSIDQLKRGLALAVPIGCVLFFVNCTELSMARAWESPWWVQIILFMAALTGVILTFAAVWTYYILPRESHDLRHVLVAFAYSFVVLLLFVISLDSPKAIHVRMAKCDWKKLTKLHPHIPPGLEAFFPTTWGHWVRLRGIRRRIAGPLVCSRSRSAPKAVVIFINIEPVLPQARL